MPIDDPNTWLQGASAVKAMFDSVRTAIGLVKEAESISGGNEQQKKAIDTALATASSSAAIAEAEIAKALGYEFCRCTFPPQIMLTVGRIDNNHAKMRGQVYECAACGYNTAGGWAYDRIAPPRVPPQ
jgi:hypothetical protein